MKGHKQYHLDFADAVCDLLFGTRNTPDITDYIITIEERLNVMSDIMTEYNGIDCASELKVDQDVYELLFETFRKSDNHVVIGDLEKSSFTICKFSLDEYKKEAEIDILEDI